MVLAAGVLLVVALAVFLAVGKWKNPFNRRDIPKRLGIDIQQEANGFTYTQAHGGHTLFKIHASKVVQYKEGNAQLHDVKIELYGADGRSVDRIEGAEFEYDSKAEVAKAAGAVEITLVRPGEALAIAPKTTSKQAMENLPKGGALALAAETASRGEIHVKTSGLVFDQKTGVASTNQPVEFTMAQASGSAVGASYDSQAGLLEMEHAVQLNTHRGGKPVELLAEHAEFDHGEEICQLHAASANFKGGKAQASDARVFFRDDGSAARLDATNGFVLTTATGGRLAAPTGKLEFDEHNQPRHGYLEGGVTIDANHNGRKAHGTSPTMDLVFTGEGVLQRAHLERGVKIASEEQTGLPGQVLRTHRAWASPVADFAFRNAGHGQVELGSIHGTGGVVVEGESQRGTGPVMPSHMTADDVTGTFGANSVLSAMTGIGHASIAQTTAQGTRQTTSGDRLDVQFATAKKAGTVGEGSGEPEHEEAGHGESGQIQGATVDGHVVLAQQPAAKPGATAPSTLRATGDRAVYEGVGELLHLTGSPRVEDGDLQLAADKIDLSQASGDAFAHGNVKATWFGSGSGDSRRQGGTATGQKGVVLGGQGPAHAIAAEAQLHESTGEATFRGQARLWQQANSIAGPVIVLDRTKQTLVARTTNPADPVRVVLLSAAGQGSGKNGKASAPSVIRVSGGDLSYSAGERKAVMRRGAVSSVVAATAEATTNSAEVELILVAQGDRAGKDGATAQVDRLTARGQVEVSSQGRRGTGEQLVYTASTDEYVLTGTTAVPPKLTDTARGTVTGEALIFNSRDDSVSIEGGGGQKTATETSVKKK